MAHLDSVIIWTWALIKSTFSWNLFTKFSISFITMLIWFITEWNWFIIWCIFMIYLIDLFTWVWKALYLWEFESRKFFMWCTKLLIYWIFMVISVSVWQVLFIWNSLLSWVFWFILITDSISILENLELLWYNTPTWLKKYLKVYNDNQIK
jgi:phage-related holin